MRKNLGQHFLTSRQIARDVVGALGRLNEASVVEIGPGTGVLTELLLARAERVIAIEKDEALAEALSKRFSGKNIEVHADDIRNFDPETLGLSNYKLIGNIPYYITGKILRLTLSATPQPTTAVFMVQKEVAERIMARDGLRARSAQADRHSLLSISVHAYGTPRYIRTVKRGSFSPTPKVDSAIIAIENISRDFFVDISEETFFKLVRRGFAHKRKQLKGNLALSKDVLRACDVPPQARAETLSLQQWRCLAVSVP